MQTVQTKTYIQSFMNCVVDAALICDGDDDGVDDDDDGSGGDLMRSTSTSMSCHFAASFGN
jgi:hypothetical protein